MDKNRLFAFIVITVAILLGYQLLATRYLPPPPKQVTQTHRTAPKSPAPAEGGPAVGAPAGTPQVAKVAPPAGASLTPPAASAPHAEAKPKPGPQLKIDAPALHGAISLTGARIDSIVLNDYRETEAANSPGVRLLEPLDSKHPYYVQYGWSAAPGEQVKVPGADTVWTASSKVLGVNHPVTLSWNNGQGLDYRIQFAIDDHYMFTVHQTVRNTTGKPVELYPWSRVRRDYKPKVDGDYILFEGLIGITNGTLQEWDYSSTKSHAKDKSGHVAYEKTSTGGWGGITDKYWLIAMVPDQKVPTTLRYRYTPGGSGHYQVDYVTEKPQTIAPGATATLPTHLFTGAKVVDILNYYGSKYNIPSFDKAVDWGWFWFFTKPIFYCLDYLNALLGNFGLAIIAFTVCAKALFFPLAAYSYSSMSKMRLLTPKVTALRERLKDEPQKMQAEMMALYKAEKVNPASGCLPMLVQIPVFFALYKVIYITIEMRQAPFFGWITDLSQADPTNVFTLFGLIPWDPTAISPWLHLGAWPLIMGITMWLQQKVNPTSPDPTQAKLMQLMPVVFTFMLARFPAGLVIYYAWSNTIALLQQWVILRRTKLSRTNVARTT